MTSPRTYIVRHGAMRFLGEFQATQPEPLARGTRVIVRTDRGTELGQVLSPAHPAAVAAIPEPTRGDIVRVATPADAVHVCELAGKRPGDFQRAEELIQQHGLAMQLVEIERLFGEERIIFYYLADGRVDFRELVKSMAREFRCRIELRQIGVRDEAKLLADYGDCGRPVCCSTHLVVMPPVSMRMAKLQKASLDPNKVSGRCGRLKCCLRYEQDVYDEFLQQLPEVGTRVVTKTGTGRVLAQEILARRLLVEFEDGRRLPVPLADVLTRL